MIVVIIAGGSGTRLWPLSTPDYPKHLLSVDGDDASLLQKTYERAKRIGRKVYVITDRSHVHHVREQLQELDDDCCIVEPARRGTAGCIVMALARLSEKQDTGEAIAFVAADHYVRDIEGFVHSFRIAETASKKEERIVLVGVEPNHPSTGLGYIQKNGLFDEKTFVFNVGSFKEKPDHATAQQYLETGDYLWNCSYFVGSIDTFVKKMAAHAPDLAANYRALVAESGDQQREKYLSFESNSIDYGLIEKVDDLLVVPASFDWMDLGSYSDLHQASSSDNQGNHVRGEAVELEGVENSFVQNYENKPVAVIGLDNIVVINTKDGILVARKDASQKIGEVGKRFNMKQEQ